MDVFSLSATIGLDSSKFLSGLNVAGKAFTAFARTVGQFGSDVIQTGIGFDKAMSSVQAVLGQTEGTMENMERLRSFALEQAHDSIYTAEQTADAYYYMGMAGWKTEQMIAGLPGVLHLAAATGEDLSKVSDIVTDSITAFGLSADDVTEYVDILAQTATNSNTDVKKMGDTFKYVASLAHAAGADYKDVALAIGIMANQGTKAGTAGTYLRSIFSRLATDTSGARTALERMGVQVFDTEGNMRDFSDLIMDARDAWKSLTAEEQLSIAKQIGGQRAMTGWLNLMQADEEQIRQLQDAYENAGGAAQRMAETQLDNLWGDIEQFKEAYDVLKISLFDDVNAPLREFVQMGTDGIDRITAAVEEGGLLGGVKQLSQEIKDMSAYLKPMIEELGTAIAPILQTLIESLGPAFISAGAAIADGLLKGLSEGLQKSDNVLLQGLGYLIGGVPTGESTDALYQTPEMGGYQPLPYGADMYGDVYVGADTSSISDEIANAVENTETDPVPVDADTSSIPGDITSAVDSVGTLTVPVVASFQGFAGGLSGLFGGGGGHFAKATYGGRILHGATVFGMDSNGMPLVGGESSPEAVVGVGSLHQMINDSVSGAFSGMLDRLDGMIDRMPGGNMRVVLDTGALVGGLVSEMDMSLNDRAVWKGYGRTL